MARRCLLAEFAEIGYLTQSVGRRVIRVLGVMGRVTRTIVPTVAMGPELGRRRLRSRDHRHYEPKREDSAQHYGYGSCSHVILLWLGCCVPAPSWIAYDFRVFPVFGTERSKPQYPPGTVNAEERRVDNDAILPEEQLLFVAV